MWSYIPEEWIEAIPDLRPDEIPMGTGLHADRAWQRTIGDRRVIVAVLDSGIRWDKSDLMSKHYLNKAELENFKPTPLADSEDEWDVNGDGNVNVADILTLLAAFGLDC